MTAGSYDRSKEPRRVKTGGSTIRWGIDAAARDSESAPDAVFHRGDFGKEPMIIVFGRTPSEVLKKVSKVVR